MNNRDLFIVFVASCAITLIMVLVLLEVVAR